MTLLHGGGAKGTGRRRGDRQRSSDADSGPILRSLLPRTVEPGDDTGESFDGPPEPGADLDAGSGLEGRNTLFSEADDSSEDAGPSAGDGSDRDQEAQQPAGNSEGGIAATRGDLSWAEMMNGRAPGQRLPRPAPRLQMGHRQYDLRTPAQRAEAEQQLDPAPAGTAQVEDEPGPSAPLEMSPEMSPEMSAWQAKGAIEKPERAVAPRAVQPHEALTGTPDLTVGYAESYVDSSADVMEVAGEFIHRDSPGEPDFGREDEVEAEEGRTEPAPSETVTVVNEGKADEAMRMAATESAHPADDDAPAPADPTEPDVQASPIPVVPVEELPVIEEALTLDAALHRIADSGPTPADVLDELVRDAGLLMDAPTRIASVVDDRLVWTAAYGDDTVELGSEVLLENTACGAAWGTALIQHVASPDLELEPETDDEIMVFAGSSAELTTECCGSAAAVLAVPLLRAAPAATGRHASITREVLAVLAFTAQRPGWFTDADIESTADLAEVAGERIAVLEADEQQPVSPDHAQEIQEREVLQTIAPPDDELATIMTVTGSFSVVPEVMEDAGIDRLAVEAVNALPRRPIPSDSPSVSFDHWFTPSVQAAPMDLDNPAATAVFGALSAAEPMLPPGPTSPVAPSTDQDGQALHDPFGLFTPRQREYQAEFPQQTVDQAEDEVRVSAFDRIFGSAAAVAEAPEHGDAPTPPEQQRPEMSPAENAFAWADEESLDEALTPEGEDASPETARDDVVVRGESGEFEAAVFAEAPMGERRARRARDRASRLTDEAGEPDARVEAVAELAPPEVPDDENEDAAKAEWFARVDRAERGAQAERAERVRQAELAERTRVAELAERARQAEEAERARRAERAERIRQAELAERAGPVEDVAQAEDLVESQNWVEPVEAAQEVDAEPQQDEIWIRESVLDLDAAEIAETAETVETPEPPRAAPTTMHARLAELREAPRVVNRAQGSPESRLTEIATVGLLTPPGGSTVERPNGSAQQAVSLFPADHQRMPAPRPRRERPQSGKGLPASMPSADSMGLWQWDAVDNTVTWSSPVARLLGLPAEADLDLATIRDALAGADRGRFDVAVQAIVSGRGVAGALRLRTRDGQAKHAYAWSEVRRDEDGSLLGAWGGVVDITAFERDADSLRSGLAGLRAAQELAGLATWEWRPESQELIWSDEMYRLVGVSAETFEPDLDRWHAFIHPDDLARARRVDVDLDADGPAAADDGWVETFRLIGTGGEIRHVQSWATPGRAPDGTITAVYGATIDVTRQVRDRMELERIAATDPVTGLGNRAAYERRLHLLLRASAPTPGMDENALSVLLIDLDRFKVVNDGLGHETGDRLLIEVARRLVAVVPDGSLIARMSGDEFVVVVPPGWSQPQVVGLGQNVLEALRAPYVLPESGEVLICPGSVGIAGNRNRPGSTGADLLREADIALHRAKAAGRDGYAVFDEALREETRERRRAEQRLRQALAADALALEYQPIIDLASNRIVGAEALVRLQDPDGGVQLIAPGQFLDIAERTGLIVDIDTWVINSVIDQLREWTHNTGQLRAADARIGDQSGRGQLQTPWLAINLSARSTEHPGLAFHLIDAVRRGDFGPEKLKVELTEQAFVNVDPAVESALRELISAGIGVGIDDFGSGSSALSNLQSYSFDFMKIDRCFVAPVGEDSRADAVVTAIVDLAHAHGMRVVAEGVESGRQARRLREIGCDYAQGYHFGRPGEATAIIRG